MRHEEDWMEGAAGFKVYYQCWLPDHHPRALVLLVHGAGEHSGRYAALAGDCCAAGYAVAALDQIGHGRSGGDYGHMASFDHYLQTLARFKERMGARFSGLPVILLGHSMGGLIAGCFLLQHQHELAGCVLSGAALKGSVEPGFLELAIIRLLSRLLPKMGVLQLDAAGVSRDPAVVEAYVTDPLVHHGKLSARFIAELFRAMDEIRQRAAEIQLPLLILHGEQDNMVSPAGSAWLYSAVSSVDKQLKLYPQLYHEILNEPEREQVIADVLAWCEQRIAEHAGN